jgi:hypothetical protein
VTIKEDIEEDEQTKSNGMQITSKITSNGIPQQN